MDTHLCPVTLCILHNLLNVVALIQYFSLSHPVHSVFFRWSSVIISNLCLSCLCFKKETCWLLADSKWIGWIFVGGFFKPKGFHVDLIYVSSKTFILVEGLSPFSVNWSRQIIITYLSKETYIFTCNLILFQKAMFDFQRPGFIRNTPTIRQSPTFYSSHFLSRQQKQTWLPTGLSSLCLGNEHAYNPIDRKSTSSKRDVFFF